MIGKTKWIRADCISCGKPVGYVTKKKTIVMCQECAMKQNKGVWLE